MGNPSSPPSIYPYDASKVLPIIFAVIVAVLALSLFHQSYRYKWIHFCCMTTGASIVWLAGIIIRTVSVFNPSSVALFIAQYVLIFTGPPLYAASEYFILGRLLEYLPYHAPLHPGRVMTSFLLLNAAVEGLAASGAASSSSADPNSEGHAAAMLRIKVALILQEVLEVFFFGLVVLVEYRCRRARQFPHNVRVVCRILYVTSLMMTLRCVVRTVEGFEATKCDPYAPDFKGYCGPVQQYEWFLWVFEIANITVIIALLVIFHPGRYLPSDTKQYLDPADSTTERLGPGYSAVDKRPFLITILDPFDMGRIFTGKGAIVDTYWERENPVAEQSFAAKKNMKNVKHEETLTTG